MTITQPESFDVVIVGASFSGLTLAHHLPKTLKVLIVDAKPTAGATVESTGLITEHTREEFKTFFPIDDHITNPITTIAVIAPNYDDWFVSQTASPWIYQTDTKSLVKTLAATLPKNVTLKTSTAFTKVDDQDQPKFITLLHQGKQYQVETKFLVGADGGNSKVAQVINGLSKNKNFLFGFEQVHYGEVHLGPIPEETIYHFWFGEFSLGYGGWLSPTRLNGKPAFRIGIAKLPKDRGEVHELLKRFLSLLQRRGIITITNDPNKPDYVFGSHIPIGGVLKNIHHNNTLLIGDAGGFCGAFAADGIKGSVVSGKESANVITRFLSGEPYALQKLKPQMNKHHSLMHYYKKQVHYRFIWDLMKRDRTFTQMYKVIESEKESFLEQFCDSKEKRKSLAWTVIKFKHVPKLVKYTWYLFCDRFARKG